MAELALALGLGLRLALGLRLRLRLRRPGVRARDRRAAVWVPPGEALPSA